MRPAIVKRPRAGGYHVKTGCKTCKIRHVKCDEEKPSCSKCRSTGRVCDGYETKQSACKPPEYGSAHFLPMEARMNALSLTPGPRISIAGTDQERRSFAFFCSQTGQQLSIALNIPQTQKLILQASHFEESARYAVIALGSIGERLLINNVLTMENEEANACHEFAQLQYYKALKHLRERISHDSEGSASLATILCFLFTVFEYLQGNDAGSMIHLRSGLNLLRRDHGSLSTGLQTVSPDRDPLKYDVLRIFSIMDMQATMWLGLRSFQAPVMIPLDGYENGPTNHSLFRNMEHVAESLNYHITTMYRFRRLVAFDDAESPDQVPPALHLEREKLLMQMKKWPVSLATFLANLGGELDAVLSQRIVVMKMNFHINLIILTACLQPSDQEVYADHEPEFRKIVDLARSVIVPPMDEETKIRIQHIVAINNGFINPIPLFSFYAGVIQPLYLTAVKCQNLSLCREAITLLASSPWREGAWDSATMARIAARRVQELDNTNLNTDPWILT